MATPVQTGKASASLNSTITNATAFTAPLTVGNQVVCGIALSGSINNPSPTVSTVSLGTDSLSLISGATKTNGSANTGVRVELWSGKVITSGQTTLAVTTSSGSNIKATAAEYLGSTYGLLVEVPVVTNSGAATPAATGNITTNWTDLLVAFYGAQSATAFTAPTNSFSNELANSGVGAGTGNAATGQVASMFADLGAVAAGTTSTGETSGSTWAVVLGAFQQIKQIPLSGISIPSEAITINIRRGVSANFLISVEALMLTTLSRGTKFGKFSVDTATIITSGAFQAVRSILISTRALIPTASMVRRAIQSLAAKAIVLSTVVKRSQSRFLSIGTPAFIPAVSLSRSIIQSILSRAVTANGAVKLAAAVSVNISTEALASIAIMVRRTIESLLSQAVSFSSIVKRSQSRFLSIGTPALVPRPSMSRSVIQGILTRAMTPSPTVKLAAVATTAMLSRAMLAAAKFISRTNIALLTQTVMAGASFINRTSITVANQALAGTTLVRKSIAIAMTIVSNALVSTISRITKINLVIFQVTATVAAFIKATSVVTLNIVSRVLIATARFVSRTIESISTKSLVTTGNVRSSVASIIGIVTNALLPIAMLKRSVSVVLAFTQGLVVFRGLRQLGTAIFHVSVVTFLSALTLGARISAAIVTTGFVIGNLGVKIFKQLAYAILNPRVTAATLTALAISVIEIIAGPGGHGVYTSLPPEPDLTQDFSLVNFVKDIYAWLETNFASMGLARSAKKPEKKEDEAA